MRFYLDAKERLAPVAWPPCHRRCSRLRRAAAATNAQNGVNPRRPWEIFFGGATTNLALLLLECLGRSLNKGCCNTFKGASGRAYGKWYRCRQPPKISAAPWRLSCAIQRETPRQTKPHGGEARLALPGWLQLLPRPPGDLGTAGLPRMIEMLLRSTLKGIVGLQLCGQCS